jgi:hypothetical protein
MEISDLVSISAVITGLVAGLGWWLRSRLENSIKHEYDRIILALEAQQRRNDSLHAERLSAYKVLSKKLLSLRRYCNARSAEFGDASEYEPRTEALTEDENISLLMHSEILLRSIDEFELIVSQTTREQFDSLFEQLSFGFNLELWLIDSKNPEELNAPGLYDSVVSEVNETLDALYNDLGFRPHEAAANNSFKPTPDRGSAYVPTLR